MTTSDATLTDCGFTKAIMIWKTTETASKPFGFESHLHIRLVTMLSSAMPLSKYVKDFFTHHKHVAVEMRTVDEQGRTQYDVLPYNQAWLLTETHLQLTALDVNNWGRGPNQELPQALPKHSMYGNIIESTLEMERL